MTTITIARSTTETDGELAARFARDAAPHFDALTRRARNLTNCDADAEDLLQDTLLHAYRGFGSFREGTNLKAWLYRIMHNRWVSTHRYKQRRPLEVPADDVSVRDFADGVGRLSAQRCAPESEVLDTLSDSDVKNALANLPDGVRRVLYYSGVEGYTYAETAALMDIPIGTVMSRVARGRERLRIALAHLDHNRDDTGVSDVTESARRTA